MRLVFLGTPDIAVSSLKYFIQKEDIEVVAVVTQPDKPAGRGKKLTPPPVKVVAEENNLRVFQPVSIRKDQELLQTLRDLQPDIFITVAFGQILSQEVLDIPKLGTINLHASLLPKYRGANPIQRAIVNGEKVSGVTTMLTDIGIDTGDMLLKQEIEITENMTSVDLANKISEIGPELLYRSIIGLADGSIKPIPQNHDEATHAAKFKKEDGLINWNQSASSIHNQVRGMLPWPVAYTYFNNNVVKIVETELIKNKENIKIEPAGKIVNIIKSGIEVATGNGLILVKKLQPPGKSVMDAYSWANGARITPNDQFTNEIQGE